LLDGLLATFCALADRRCDALIGADLALRHAGYGHDSEIRLR